MAVSTDSHVIVGVEETDRRNDAGLAGSTVELIKRRCGARPARLLALGGKGVEVYTPPAPVKRAAKAAGVRRRERGRVVEPAALRAWRARMAVARRGKRSIVVA